MWGNGKSFIRVGNSVITNNTIVFWHCWHFELYEYDDVSEGDRQHGSQGAPLNTEQAQASQGAPALKLLEEKVKCFHWIGP